MSKNNQARNAAKIEQDSDYIDLIDKLISDWREQRPDLDPSPMNVVGRLLRVGRQMEAEITEVLKPHGLSYTEFDVLATLLRSGKPYELTPTELRESVILTSGAMTALLDRLTRKQLIRRNTTNADGRIKTAQLTTRGTRQINKLIDLRFKQAAEASAALTSRQKLELAGHLRILEQALNKPDH